jgi:hypothetical protein
MDRQFGIDYDPVRHQYVLWDGGDDVWVLKSPSVIGRSGWSIQRADSPGGIVPVFVGEYGGGVLGKWKYVPELDAFVALENPVAGNVWIYKPKGWKRPTALAAPPLVPKSPTLISVK